MAKFYGAVGYAQTVETSPGVWQPVITERDYFGDIVRNMRRYEASGQVNDDLNIANEISIVADPFACQNFQCMRYVEFMGAKWKILSAEIQHPRIILTIGGVYNGESED